MKVLEIGCGPYPGPRFEGADELKVEILNETARVLKPKGKLVVIETESPPFASQFFDNTNIASLALSHTMPIGEVPASYANYYNKESWIETWIGLKA